MSEHGYIALARGVLDHPIVGARKPYSRHEAWEWLLHEAAWKPRRYAAGSLVVELRRGQLAHSTRYMAKAWGWPETNVRRFLTRLKTNAMIGAVTGAGVTVITITNYDAYQRGQSEAGAATGATVAQQRRRKEKGKKDNTIRPDEPEGFAEWYATYPRKMQRKDAARAYRRAVKEISPADLLVRTVAFAASHRDTPPERTQYIPYPASWLNKDGYLDQVADQLPEQRTRDAKTFTEAEWRNCLALHRSGERWPDLHWGPPPGSPGCFVPAKLLIEKAGSVVWENRGSVTDRRSQLGSGET